MKRIFLIFALAAGAAQAQQLRVGMHSGALGLGKDTGIGYGGHFVIVPYENLALMVDATFAKPALVSYFSSSPTLIAFMRTTEEARVGAMGGGGFYKFGGESVKFGANVGIMGDFMLNEMVSVGTQVRYHAIFGSNADAWNVFLTLSFGFQAADGGW